MSGHPFFRNVLIWGLTCYQRGVLAVTRGLIPPLNLRSTSSTLLHIEFSKFHCDHQPRRGIRGHCPPAEISVAKRLGLQFISKEMPSTLSPSDSEVNEILAILEDQSNYRIFVHCKLGEDRVLIFHSFPKIELRKIELPLRWCDAPPPWDMPALIIPAKPWMSWDNQSQYKSKLVHYMGHNGISGS